MNIAQVSAFSLTLKAHIDKNNLAIDIDGKRYPLVDGYKFAAVNFGLKAICDEPVPQHDKKDTIIQMYTPVQKKNRKTGESYTALELVYAGPQENKEAIDYIRTSPGMKITKELYRPYYSYKCNCNVFRVGSGEKMSFGQGMCNNLEDNRLGSPEFSINSMSQTRAVGRALKNQLGFVMTMAGFEATNAEDMSGLHKDVREDVDQQSALEPATQQQLNDIAQKIEAGDLTLVQVMQHVGLDQEQGEALSAIQFRVEMKEVMKGTRTIEEVQHRMPLTDSQKETLNIALKNK